MPVLSLMLSTCGYFSYKDMHDPSISPDVLSSPDSNLSKEKSGLCVVCCGDESFKVDIMPSGFIAHKCSS